MKKQDAPLDEALQSLRYAWNHRTGLPIIGKQLKLGRKVLYFDNHIPGLIMDVFQNRRYEMKDGTKPVIAAKRRTEYGWHLVINLPPGVSFSRVVKDREYFQDATNSWIDLRWEHGKCHMDIQLGELPTLVPYTWTPPTGYYLPIPIGYSRTKLITLDLPDSPHLLIGGATMYGKTSAITGIIHATAHQAIIILIDLKGLDFGYLADKIPMACDNATALLMLKALQQEFERRKNILRAAGCRKIQEYQGGDMPYIILVIDELAELDDDCMTILDRLVRLARATGISVIAATQRPSVKVLPGDTRSNFVARLCFRTATEADSRVILGEDCGLAGTLPAIKGRAIYRYGIDTIEVQSMYLPPGEAEMLARQIPPMERMWDIGEAKPQAKRLPPRQ